MMSQLEITDVWRPSGCVKVVCDCGSTDIKVTDVRSRPRVRVVRCRACKRAVKYCAGGEMEVIRGGR